MTSMMTLQQMFSGPRLLFICVALDLEIVSSTFWKHCSNWRGVKWMFICAVKRIILFDKSTIIFFQHLSLVPHVPP